MKCQYCKTENKDDAKICKKCFASLKKSEKPDANKKIGKETKENE